ncbi:MAG: ATP-binding protein [Thermoleophilia bacterium]
MRPPGLQTWLVAALIAVGALASFAVLASVLPTLESTLRRDASLAQSRDLLGELRRAVAEATANDVDDSDSLGQLASRVAVLTGAQVRFTLTAPDKTRVTGQSLGECCALLDEFDIDNSRAQGAGTLSSYRYVYAKYGTEQITFGSAFPPRRPVRGTLEGVAAARSRGISDRQLADLQRRLVVAVAAVLGVAVLAGYSLSRLVGQRISVLARTASRLAGGDLSARAPGQRLREFSVLGESLNTMAGRIENQVGQITSERDRARMLISSLAEGVIGVDRDGSIRMMNPAARRLLGLHDAASVRRVADLPAAIREPIEDAADEDIDDAVEYEIALPDGTELQVIASRIAAPASGMVVTMRDVTESRRLERARRDLVANVSHELKTPLAAIKGLIELLQSPRVAEDDREEFIDLMEGEADRLERLVEEQLQLARLDSGGLPLEREPIDLDALAENVVASRTALAEVDGVTLRADVPDGPVTVTADAARIEQILLILLDNALRHTPAGGTVTVAVQRETESAQLRVIDTGEGVPVDEQDFIFDRFYRGDRSREGRSAGLGLPIARGLATAHGGTLDLVSVPGVGSTFTLTLPTGRMPEAPDVVGLLGPD